jgi:hypothetical protein
MHGQRKAQLIRPATLMSHVMDDPYTPAPQEQALGFIDTVG